MSWTPVCRLDDLVPDRGVRALLGSEHVAVFLLATGELAALANHDPFSGASILSRGIVGSRGDEPFVASPMHKQAFSLRTGRCLDDDSVAVPTYATRLRDGYVEVEALAS